MHSLARALALPLLVASTLAVSGCADGTPADAASGTGGGAGGAQHAGGGGDAAGGAGPTCAANPVCALEAPGPKFTFHVHNAGTQQLALTYGCGSALPVTLTTPKGELPIGPGDLSFCGFSCDQLYCSDASAGCSDCGPGYGAALAPGATADIAWDRRVFVDSTAPAECRPGGDTPECSFGSRLAPSASQPGTLTVCTAPAAAGYCSLAAEIQVPFTIDTTGNGATVEVM